MLGAIPRRDIEALSAGQMLACEIAGRKILVCRVGAALHAVENRCSHAAVELAGGSLAGHEVECPFHGARFDVRDGRALAAPARRPIAAFDLVPRADVYELRERFRGPAAA